MNSIPAEIKRMIAFQLRNCDQNSYGPRDIKAFRLVSKEFSVIGAEYLLPVIHLTFQSKSFERLRTISQHPFFSHHVTRLHYEPDAFGRAYECSEEWVKHTLRWDFPRDGMTPARSESNGGPAKLVYNSDPEKFKVEVAAAAVRHRKNYKAYRAVCADQMSIRHQIDAYNGAGVALAIGRLPNLTEVNLHFANDVVSSTSAFKSAYAETIASPHGDYDHRYPYGVVQLYSILDGVASANTKLKSLSCCKVHWQLLKMGQREMGIMKRAFKSLENLRIMFYVGEGYLDYAHLEAELARCEILLANYRLCELLSAAKDLQTLILYIDRSGGSELEYMVGTTTLACLRVVELNSIHAAEETLINFLKRHAATLKVLGLSDIYLKYGGWMTALPRIRDTVRLEELRAHGLWRTRSPFQVWAIETSLNSLSYGDSRLSPPCLLGKAVDRYLHEGGKCPLPDFVTF